MVHEQEHDAHEDDEPGNVPQLVLDAEAAYIERAQPTIRATADAFGFAHGTMLKWAQRRRWAARRRATENEAARRLAEHIDGEAAEKLADQIGSMRSRVFEAAQLAAATLLVYTRREQAHIKQQLESGERFKLPAKTIEILQLAERLASRLGDGADAGPGGVLDVEAVMEEVVARREQAEGKDWSDVLEIDERAALAEGVSR